ncbi:MAG: argininosuccinate lyase, partial [Thermoplasmata archaeon]|nr:argininosuccinate lyase [Thermoplasmata archaeon]
VKGLKEVARGLGSSAISLDTKYEDVHMNIEKHLIDIMGDTGAKLHPGRSRNDQVALDMRLVVREEVHAVVTSVFSLEETLLRKAQNESMTIMPGYTHLQHAQPVLLSHHLMAHFWRLQRDISRLVVCYERANVSPLGSGALAGTWSKFDRSIAANMLGMDGTTENSLDAVSDRDFAAEFVFALSLLMIHLSSLSEELVLWSSGEFGFLKLPLSLSGGSSMMPQKCNPDIAELVRGKSGRAIGDLVAILTLLKSLPLAYNRDLQEDKENLFDAFDTAEASLHALTTFLAEAEFDRARMRKAAEVGLMTATDLADLLTTRGIPFRNAHDIVKELAVKADGDDLVFKELAKEVLMRFSKDLKTIDLAFLNVERAIDRRGSEGGTSKKAVKSQMLKAEAALVRSKQSAEKMRGQISKADRLLW